MMEANPFQKNMRVELLIDGMTNEGQGVGHLNGVAFFVPESCVGEKVLAHIIKVEKRYCIAKLVNVVEASPNRTEPRCPVYSLCGGCTMQHMTYEEQLRLKRQFVVDAFERIGGISDVDVQPVLGMEDPWHYRNKGSFPFGKENKYAVYGFYASRSHRLIPISDCAIQNESVIKAADAVASWANECGISVYDEESGYGTLRACVVRVTENNQVMAVIVTHGKLPYESKLIEKTAFIDSVYHNRNDKKTNVLMGDEFRLLYGEPVLIERMNNVEYFVSPQSFLQVNSQQTSVLYKTALDMLKPAMNETILDLYCGIGTISLQIAKTAGRVIGVECVPEAISDAKKNAENNKIQNIDFICELTENALPQLLQNNCKVDAICLDPPRKGCDPKAIKAITESGADRIVYISCNPATLARDIGYMIGEGYEIKCIQPVDMFPHTAHVECVVLMTRK